jgi:hypothetical protein
VIYEARPLKLRYDFFGADESPSDYDPGAERWAAKLIHRGDDAAETWRRRNATIMDICRSSRLSLPDRVVD